MLEKSCTGVDILLFRGIARASRLPLLAVSLAAVKSVFTGRKTFASVASPNQ